LVKPLHPISEIASRVLRVDHGHVQLSPSSASRNGSHVDPAKATIAALAEPIEFPPLAAGVVPGDRVAIAVDGAIPCMGDIVRGAVKALENAGVESDAISVVACDGTTNQICREACAAEASRGVQFVVHDPEDEQNLCIAGMTKRGIPLLINRVIFDADIVLPIGCARLNGRGAYEGLYPLFSNAEAIQRYRTPASADSPREIDLRTRETNEAGWLIGVPMVVEVVPGGGESVEHVLAGEPTAVAVRSQELLQERWSFESPRQVNLMIATVTGGPESQNWVSVGRALATAENLVVDGGAIAICSNLSEPPGHSLGRLIGNPDLESAERKISHDHDADSWPAWQLARALQRGPVYFLSQLDSETVEDLGLAPVESVDELVRLAARSENFVVIEDSQNAVVTLAGQTNEW
jgi:nickel-dependent lactate racemase